MTLDSFTVGNDTIASTSSTPYPISGPTSPQSSLISSGLQYITFPTFTLESGIILHNIPLAFKTWGKLDPKKKNNALVVCHALTGSADVEDWWGPLLGPGKLFDPTRFFIVCSNVLGSPYGSAGPCTKVEGHTSDPLPDWNGEGWWGPEFPATTVRDDVRITKQLLDFLGVEQIAAVVGGSMGGMSVLEWPLLYPVRFPQGTPSKADEEVPSSPKQSYIRALVPLATAARHSAWCISWAEAQRQSIYSDPLFDHGYYHPSQTPRSGLAAARMAALLTYRSRESFESRFGRRIGGPNKGGGVGFQDSSRPNSDRRSSLAQQAAMMHNEGNQSPRVQGQQTGASITSLTDATLPPATVNANTTSFSNGAAHKNQNGSVAGNGQVSGLQTKPFSAQSYLRYQGDKFVRRFDANCYIHLTRKMDTHDVARGRAHWGLPGSAGTEPITAKPIEMADLARERNPADQSQEVTVGEQRLPREGEEDDEALQRVLSLLSVKTYRQGALAPPVLVVSVESDGLFAPPEQELLHQFIRGSEIVTIRSPDGHDGFLLEFVQINDHVGRFLRKVIPDVYEGKGVGYDEWMDWTGTTSENINTGGERVVKESMSGEVEDLTRW